MKKPTYKYLMKSTDYEINTYIYMIKQNKNIDTEV